MASIVFWDPGAINEGATYQTNVWDTCWIGNLQLPGLVNVHCAPLRQVDKKKPHGGNGQTLTPRGYDPQPVIITVMIWTSDQWDAWCKVTPILWPKGSKPPKDKGFQIRHPETDLWGISSIYILSPSSSAKGPVEQSKIWTLKCVENLDPGKTSAVVQVKGSDVALAPTFQATGALNEVGDPPSKTDTGPKGPPKTPKAGTL